MHWLLPTLKGIKVLMYHHVWPGMPDYLTVTPLQLEEQFSYLKKHGYNTIFVSELVDAIFKKKELPPKTIALTFDDGYKNQVRYVAPLLEKFNFKACIFLIGDKLTIPNSSLNGSKETYLRIEEIREANPQYFEFGLHSFSHRPFSSMTLDELKTDLTMNKQVLSAAHITTIPVFAYPYGDRYSNKEKLNEARHLMQECGIKAAFRIGNGSITFPVKNIFELKRIDINGFDDLKRFAIKLGKGKLKPF